MYDHVDDVDLFVGGFLEQRDTPALLGPIFRCIVGDTFVRLKYGDRFWYDLGIDKDTRFTRKQLRQIRKASMSRIICDNTYGLTKIQPEAFKNPNPFRFNPVVSCKDTKKIKSLDLSSFKGI